MKKSSRKSLMISFLALLISMPVSAYNFECDGIYYDLLEDPYGEHPGLIEEHTLAVVPGDSTYRGDIVIPSEVTIDGTTYRVTAIGHIGQVHPYVFRNCSELTSVTIPKSVTAIGATLFGTEQKSGWKEFAKISEGTTNIDGIPTTTSAPEGYYSLNGRRLTAPTKGINIIRQSDGTTRKVIVK